MSHDGVFKSVLHDPALAQALGLILRVYLPPQTEMVTSHHQHTHYNDDGTEATTEEYRVRAEGLTQEKVAGCQRIVDALTQLQGIPEAT